MEKTNNVIVKELIKPIRKSGIFEVGKDLSIIDYRQETAGVTLAFKSNEDYELFRDRNGLTDADFEDVKFLAPNIFLGEDRDYRLINKSIIQKFKDGNIKSEIIQHDSGNFMSFKMFEPIISEIFIKNNGDSVSIYCDKGFLAQRDVDLIDMGTTKSLIKNSYDAMKQYVDDNFTSKNIEDLVNQLNNKLSNLKVKKRLTETFTINQTLNEWDKYSLKKGLRDPNKTYQIVVHVSNSNNSYTANVILHWNAHSQGDAAYTLVQTNYNGSATVGSLGKGVTVFLNGEGYIWYDRVGGSDAVTRVTVYEENFEIEV